MFMRDCAIISFIGKFPPARLFHSMQSFSFELKRDTIGILCW